MNTYIYILKLKETFFDASTWTSRENNIIDCHFKRLEEDYKRGLVLHVGRTLDPTDDGFGVVIYQAHNDALAETYMLHDPAVKEGMMTATFKAYKVVFD